MCQLFSTVAVMRRHLRHARDVIVHTIGNIVHTIGMLSYLSTCPLWRTRFDHCKTRGTYLCTSGLPYTNASLLSFFMALSGGHFRSQKTQEDEGDIFFERDRASGSSSNWGKLQLWRNRMNVVVIYIFFYLNSIIHIILMELNNYMKYDLYIIMMSRWSP